MLIGGQNEVWLPITPHGTEQVVEGREELREVIEGLTLLPDDRREALIMRFALGSWRRVSFLNRYLGGTLVPRLELDLVPALRCAAHWVLVAEKPPAPA